MVDHPTAQPTAQGRDDGGLASSSTTTSRTDGQETARVALDVELPSTTATFQRTALTAICLMATLSFLGGLGRLVVFDSAIGNAELDLMNWVVEHRTGVLDTAATIGSSSTDTWTVIGVLVGAIVVLMIAGHRRFAAMMAIAICLEFTAFLVVGQIIGRPRPDVETLHSVPFTPSFPSGHVAAAAVVFGSLSLIARTLAPYRRAPGRVWIVPVVAAAIVAASRVYEGVHYPTDVAAGFLLGVGAVWGAAFATGVARTAEVRPRRADEG